MVNMTDVFQSSLFYIAFNYFTHTDMIGFYDNEWWSITPLYNVSNLFDLSIASFLNERTKWHPFTPVAVTFKNWYGRCVILWWIKYLLIKGTSSST